MELISVTGIHINEKTEECVLNVPSFDEIM